jgi:hypothetical protein
MIQESFYRESNESLILISCDFPNHTISLALDTGASHTTIDLTALQIAGYGINDVLETTNIETASGIIEAYIIEIKEFKAFGITKHNFKVCAYDFFAHHVLSDFDGVLGLDFFLNYKICIDFKNSLITIT